MITRVLATACGAVIAGTVLLAPAAAAPLPASVEASASAFAEASKKNRAPAVVTGVGGANSVSLTWRPPLITVDAKPPYVVKYDVSQKGVGLIESRATSTALQAKNLADNTKYTFTVTAYLNGKKGGSKSVTVLTKPGRLINPRAEGNTVVAWSAPEMATEPLTYTVWKGSEILAVGVVDTSIVVEAPEAGKSQSYSVAAVNASGEGPKSTVRVETPKAPTGK